MIPKIFGWKMKAPFFGSLNQFFLGEIECFDFFVFWFLSEIAARLGVTPMILVVTF